LDQAIKCCMDAVHDTHVTSPLRAHHVSKKLASQISCSPIAMQGIHGDQVVVEAEVGAARDDNTAGGVRFSACVVEVSLQPGLQAVQTPYVARLAHAACSLGCSLQLITDQAHLRSGMILLVHRAADSGRASGFAAYRAHLL
jgi:hypothetical protein